MDSKYRFRCLGYFDSVLRFYEKLKTAHDGYPFKKEHMVEFDAGELTDIVFAFFIVCHHMKDWIINDDQVDQKVRDVVEDFVHHTSCLRFCADIANGYKHFKLDRHQRSKKRPQFVNIKRSIIAGKVLDIRKVDSGEYSDAIVKDEAILKTDDGEIGAFELASECIYRWQEFIENNIYKEAVK
ncbi:MAG: hypothetical protein NT030_07550 [Candidatus Saganbacteria bacterium]|nr:hypothetical protein [Candidatus Saganbacteria bacterium]